MNKKNNTAQLILDRIEKEKLQPKARWRFIAGHVLLWVPGILATVFGGLAVSIIIFDIGSAGWEYWGITHRSLGSFFIESLPYLWIVMLGVFLSVAIWRFKKTEKGYKYNAVVLVGASMLISLILGIWGYSLGVGERLDRNLAMIPLHRGVQDRDIELWSRPDEGRFVGEIKEIFPDSFSIKTIDGDIWMVTYGVDILRDLPFILVDQKVRIVGSVINPELKEITACLVFPFDKPRPGSIHDRKKPPIPRFGFENERKLPEMRITKCGEMGKALRFYNNQDELNKDF